MSARPRASIVVSTYNHRPYIAEALDSILMQETHFAYEILVGDDASDDGTRDIVHQYAADFPHVVRPFMTERREAVPTGKDGFSLVPLSGRRLAVTMMTSTQGEYVGLLDGDDYWLTPYKLQRQVDYLDSHPDCSGCFHSAAQVFEGRRERVIRPPGARPYYGVRDLLEGNFVPTGSLLYRNGLYGALPSWFLDISMGDRPLLLLNALYGQLGYIDETLSAYRVHEGGVWSSLTEERRLALMIDAFRTYRAHLPWRYYAKCVAEQSKLSYRRARALSAGGAITSNNLPALHQVVAGHALVRELGTRRLAGMALNLYAPRAARSLRALRRRLSSRV